VELLSAETCIHLLQLEEIERRVSEVEERVRHLGVSLARSFENVRRDPAITCTNNRTILEYMLRDLWKRLRFKGSAERKQLEDLLAALPQKMEQLGEEAPAKPRRIHDLMRGIQLTGNRATHHPNEVVEDDAVASLRELSEVVLWYFVNFLPSFGKTADTAGPSAFLKEPDSNRAEVSTKPPSSQRISRPSIVAVALLVAALLTGIWFFSVSRKTPVTQIAKSTPTPTPTVPAVGRLLYEDDFATFNPGWGTPGEALNVKDGKFIITPVPDRGRDVLNQSNIFDDADITVEATMSQGDDLTQAGGLIFWGKDHNDYYCLLIKLNGRFTISRWFNDRWLNPIAWQNNPEIKTAVGQVNKLRVVTKGRQATAYINDKEVATFSGQPPPGGGCIGLYGESGKSQNIWQFSNLKVTTPQ
jgi:hypothetical protein